MTHASRKELLVLVARALAVLSPRDRQLVTWATEDLPLQEQASSLGLTYPAAQKAAQRALERLRKAFRLLAGDRTLPPSI